MNLKMQETMIISNMKRGESDELKTLREMSDNIKKMLELMSNQKTEVTYKVETPNISKRENIQKESNEKSDFIPSINIGKMEIKSSNVKTSTKSTNMDDVLSSLEKLNEEGKDKK